MQMRYRMQFDTDGRAQMYVFNTCKAFIRTINLMVYDEKRPEDLDTNMEDHVMDEARYFMMSRPIKAEAEREAEPVFFDPLNQFKK